MRRGLPIWIALMIGVLTGWTWESAGDCETGWEWSRRYVGCIQSNCNSVQHAHYGYDGTCVCSSSGSVAEKATDPTRECKRASTHASCPGCVYACVKPTEACPGEKPKVDPKKACEAQCTEYHSPGVTAKYAGGKCSCVCKEGYEPDETLTCRKVDAKKACEAKCTEYHSPGVEAKLTGGKCDCVCKKGYAPDDTLTCRKVECSEQCKAELGALGEAKGTHPDCDCACKDGFDRSGDKCLPKLDPSAPPAPDAPDLPTPREPPPAGCPPGASLDPSGETCVCGPEFIPELQDGKCKKKQATVVAFGCTEGKGTVGIRVERGGQRLSPTAGLVLTDGDKIRLSNFDPIGCKDAYLTLDWDGTLGRVILGEDLYYDFEIGDGSWNSGWPLARNNAQEAGTAVLTFLRDEFGSRGLTAVFGGTIAGVVGFLAGTSDGGVANRRVWINSYVVIHQRTDGSMRVYTKEGAPDVQFGDGPRVAVAAGMAVDFDADGTIAAPMTYDPTELDALGEAAVPWCGTGQHREGAKCVDDAPSAEDAPQIESAEDEAKRGPSRLPSVIGWIAIGLIAISALGLVVSIVRRSTDDGR